MRITERNLVLIRIHTHCDLKTGRECGLQEIVRSKTTALPALFKRNICENPVVTTAKLGEKIWGLSISANHHDSLTSES
jgi:hypothetical protein